MSDPVDDTVDTVAKFHSAIVNAGSQGIDWIEVTPEVFNYYMQGQKTDFFTYGDRGIRVFKIGEKEKIEKKLEDANNDR